MVITKFHFLLFCITINSCALFSQDGEFNIILPINQSNKDISYQNLKLIYDKDITVVMSNSSKNLQLTKNVKIQVLCEKKIYRNQVCNFVFRLLPEGYNDTELAIKLKKNDGSMSHIGIAPNSNNAFYFEPHIIMASEKGSMEIRPNDVIWNYYSLKYGLMQWRKVKLSAFQEVFIKMFEEIFFPDKSVLQQFNEGDFEELTTSLAMEHYEKILLKAANQGNKAEITRLIDGKKDILLRIATELDYVLKEFRRLQNPDFQNNNKNDIYICPIDGPYTFESSKSKLTYVAAYNIRKNSTAWEIIIPINFSKSGKHNINVEILAGLFCNEMEEVKHTWLLVNKMKNYISPLKEYTFNHYSGDFEVQTNLSVDVINPEIEVIKPLINAEYDVSSGYIDIEWIASIYGSDKPMEIILWGNNYEQRIITQNSGSFSWSLNDSKILHGRYKVTIEPKLLHPNEPYVKGESGYFSINESTSPDIYNKPVRSSFAGRNVVITKKISVSKSNIKIQVFDHETQDGDIISLYLNGMPILTKHHLTNHPITIDCDLVENIRNELFLFAHNLGEIPPNTAAIRILDGSYSESVFLESNLYNCEAVVINVKQ